VFRLSLSNTAKDRARSMSAVAAGLSIAVALLARFGFGDPSWMVVVPILASVAAIAMPTRLVVAIAMIATAAALVIELDDSGPLFGATLVALMLALNHLQDAATQIRRRRKAVAAAAQ
jgi:hypothetical protein